MKRTFCRRGASGAGWVIAALAASVIGAAPAFAQPGDSRPTPRVRTIDLANEVLYQIMPVAWRDSDNDEFRFGDFNGMTASLPYLKSLGVTGVWMTPIFPSPAYHGYQHLEADKVNPRFGTEEQFLAFVKAAHEQGIKVFIDFVAYGISQDTTYFTDSYKKPDSKHTSWLAYKDADNNTYQGYTFTTWNGAKVGFIHWNLNSPEPKNLVTTWAKRWLDPNGDGDPSDGVDGYRLDHVWKEYKEGPNGWGYNVKDFWVEWKQALRQVNPRVITFAEQAQWESTGEELLTAFDAAFTKPFELAAREALRSGKAEELYEAASDARRAARRAPKNDQGGRGTFLAIMGDHDVDRLASDIEPKSSAGTASFGRPALAAFIQFTQMFPPIIYMGDEIGMLGVRQKWGTDANDIPVREPFKWKAVAGAPMTDYWRPNKQAVQHAFSKDNDGRSVEEQEGKPGSLLEIYRGLIALRQSSEALRHGDYTPLRCESPSVWMFVRQTEKETLLVCMNLADSRVELEVPPPRVIGRWGAWSISELYHLPGAAEEAPVLNTDANAAKLTLPALGGAVYKLNRTDIKP